MLATSLLGGHNVLAIEMDINDQSSIESAAKIIASNLMNDYSGNEPGQIPGMLPFPPYYWWLSGALWMTIMEYWNYTGDAEYNSLMTPGLIFQSGPAHDFLPSNQSKNEGNDDQVFWAFACMDAAELKYPDPPATDPSWLALAQAVFNQQASRWNQKTCGGGLNWQIYTFNSGYNYKNTISNMGFFQLGARLARYTGNDTYAEWATKVWDWFEASPILNVNNTWQINDGTDENNGCVDADGNQWTYNYGTTLMGAAYMYNYTNGDPTWQERVDGVLTGIEARFFPNATGGFLTEVACPQGICQMLNSDGTVNTDRQSFKGFLAHWMASTTQMVPYTYNRIWPLLQKSAQGAAGQCSGGENGTTCGQQWNTTTYDGTTFPGNEMSALAVIQALLTIFKHAPVTSDTGGTSKSDPGAGNDNTVVNIYYAPITTGAKAGAGILTTVLIILTVGGGWWMISE